MTKLVLLLCLIFVVTLLPFAHESSGALVDPLSIQNQQSQTQVIPATKLEGCVSCHNLIEPMHKYGTTDTLEKLKDGKDAVGLTCTACHGGNPAVAKTNDDPKELERVKQRA